MDQVVPGGSGTRIELNLSAVGLVSFDFPEDVPRGKVIEFTIKINTETNFVRHVGSEFDR